MIRLHTTEILTSTKSQYLHAYSLLRSYQGAVLELHQFTEWPDIPPHIRLAALFSWVNRERDFSGWRSWYVELAFNERQRQRPRVHIVSVIELPF